MLFTAPGERVMRPDFGSGLLGLVFEPGGPELVATTQHLVQGALQQELGHLIAVESVEVSQDEGALTVSVTYVALRTQERTQASFSRSVAVRYTCCDERRLQAVKEAGVPQRDRVRRGLRLRGADAGAAPAHAVRPPAASPRPALDVPKRTC